MMIFMNIQLNSIYNPLMIPRNPNDIEMKENDRLFFWRLWMEVHFFIKHLMSNNIDSPKLLCCWTSRTKLL